MTQSADCDRPDERWNAARKSMGRLERASGRMSSSWFIGTGGIVFAAGLFLVAALVLIVNLNALRESFRQVQRTDSVLQRAVNVQVALIDAGTAARSYVVDRNAADLAALERAERTAVAGTRELATPADGDVASLQQIGMLAPLVVRWTAALDLMVRQASDSDAARLIRAGDRRRAELSREMNARLAAFRAIQRNVLRSRQLEGNRNAAFAIWLSIFTAIAAPLCGLLGVYLLQRERESHRASELRIELMHVQRLAVMGETSSMLAHEINQPLSAATNYLSALRHLIATSGAGETEKLVGIAERTNEQIQRAGRIVQRLRNFIEKRDAERNIEKPFALIEDAVSLLGTIDDRIRLKAHVEPGLSPVLVDRVQLQQVLVNLMRNALEAMQNSPRRELALSVAASGRGIVQFSLADSGPGVAEDIAAQLFKPFVSSKTDGMGVGLSICRSIIVDHGGRIWAEPNPSGGTIFHFTLPAVPESVAA